MSKTSLFLASLLSTVLGVSFYFTKNKAHLGNQPTTVEYFATMPLRESPYPMYQGVVRLSQEAAEKRNHYRFEYDSLYRLVSVSFRFKDRLKDPNHTANYFITSAETRIQYGSNEQLYTYYDRFGNSVLQRGVFKSIYKLDGQGRRVSLSFKNEKGDYIENTWGIARYVWEHQNDGSVIENRYNLNDYEVSLRPNFDFFRIRLSYEQNGVLALMQNIDEQGRLIVNKSGAAQDKLVFDSEGRWLGWVVLGINDELHRGNGPNVAKGINESNNYGYESGLRFEDVDGSPVMNSHGFWGSKRYYDQYGNYAVTHFTDSLGKPGTNAKSGYSYAKYTFDKNGFNRIKVELQDVNQQPTIHKTGGYATITYEYDSFDNRIKTNYLGLDGELINRADNGISFIRYEYDEKHKRISTKRYNKEGRLLN